jgi:mannose/cellobiose epimerase-like protein (N-acyl-D-glucosamine 2-epimerase family)
MTGSAQNVQSPYPETHMETINALNLQLPIVGKVTSKASDSQSFKVKTRGGTEFEVLIKATTWFDTVTNLDRLARQRLPLDQQSAVRAGEAPNWLATNVKEGDLIAVEGTCYINGDNRRYEALAIHLLKSHAGYYLFEHTHWWKGQIEGMANKWLDVLFGDKRTYALDDFAALYRTTLGIEGQPTDDQTQEMATLARLIYGLSSAYLLGGDERYFLAAKAGVEFQRESFRSYSADGRFCLWLHARKRDRHGIYDMLASANAEDAGTMPLYEQIYALAGLAQFYRITNDWETLQDIRRTLDTFEAMFADRRDGKLDGFFSHIDPVTFRWDSPELDKTNNRSRKNWNSVGDHLPAYLINLILALDPLPVVAGANDAAGHRKALERLLQRAVEILEVTSGLIHDKFPEPGNPYVNERFDRDWKPVHNWGWQQNRAVVGHNLKIAWNLTRVANYHKAKGNHEQARKLFELSCQIGRDIGKLGVDQVRSGVFDAVERQPADAKNFPLQFAWANTKDFWQQEQGILAYLIMFGHHANPTVADAPAFLDLARELSTFWNLYFLDRERNGIFFRISDNGIPVISSTYGDKGGHAISGYHAFELNYLAHIYQLAYLPRQQLQHTTFCLHFRPSPASRLLSINVLPDFLGPDAVEIAGIEIDGVERPVKDPTNFQIPLAAEDLGRNVCVRLRQTEAAHARLRGFAVKDDWLP